MIVESCLSAVRMYKICWSEICTLFSPTLTFSVLLRNKSHTVVNLFNLKSEIFSGKGRPEYFFKFSDEMGYIGSFSILQQKLEGITL